jgi:hypothetical protein
MIRAAHVNKPAMTWADAVCRKMALRAYWSGDFVVASSVVEKTLVVVDDALLARNGVVDSEDKEVLATDSIRAFTVDWVLGVDIAARVHGSHVFLSAA